jgi:hypothetical protein
MLCSPVFADTSDSPLRGLGVTLCSDYPIYAANGLDATGVVSWIYGYWSATNSALFNLGRPMKNIMDSTVDPAPLAAQMSAICQREPNLRIVAAATRIFQRLPNSNAEVP